MTRIWFALAVSLALGATTQASWLFPKGVGKYGPYTGGHGYSYATAYHYGFTFSAADSWNRDIYAYPGGILPYRPYGKPISKTVFPHPDTPYIAVPGPNGLHTLVKPVPPMEEVIPPGVILPPGPVDAPMLQPVPTTLPAPVPTASLSGTIKLHVPETAEVWVEKEKLTQAGAERVYRTPPLTPGKMQILNVRAKWLEGGREVEQFRVVGVKSGETAKLTFGSTQP